MSSTSKYHISPKTQRPNICKAKDGKCPLGGEHYPTSEEAKQKYQENLWAEEREKTLKGLKKKVEVNSLKQKTIPVEEKFPVLYNGHYRGFKEDCYSSGIWVNSESEWPGGECECYDEEYCRCSVITEHSLSEKSKPDGERLLRETIGLEHGTETPKSLLELVDKYKLNDLGSYESVVVSGYYGEEAEVMVKNSEELDNDVRGWIDRNCISWRDEVKTFMMGKGIDPRGRDNVELVKEQLRSENKDKRIPIVENCTDVEVLQLQLQDVYIPNSRHYENVESRKPEAPVGSPQITGVVVKKNGKYRLVDGYHRLKWSLDHAVSSGNYIILS